MRLRICLLLAVVACTGATCQRIQRPEAPVADAAPICYVAAVPSTEDTGIRWTYDPTDPKAWDDLAKVVLPQLRDAALAGERARQACAGFITDLKHRGVIRSKP